MNPPRAYEGVSVQLGGVSVELRPTMRAATILEAEVGLETIFQHLGEFRLGTIRKILTATADRGAADALMKHPLAEVEAALTGPLSQLCAGFLPRSSSTQREHRSEQANSGKPLALAEVYSALYSRATGWLHWTPDAAWKATPTEIAQALEAHLELLQAMHGAPQENDDAAASADTAELRAQRVAEGLDPDFDREGLRALKQRLTGGFD